MKFIWNGIKILLGIVCAIAAVVILILTAPSLVKGISDGDLSQFSSFLPSLDKKILDVEPMDQFPDYPTGCESVSLTMLLQYYGIYVSPDDVIANLPTGNKPYKEDGEIYGADPETAFVGSPYDKDSFGVFNGPIADTAELFKEDVKTTNGASIMDISAILSTGNPVMAWYTSHEDRDFTYDMRWYTEDGSKLIEWPSGEHAVVVCGEDFMNFYYADPFTGSIKKANKLTFRKFFNQLGGRIVYYEY
ncbi:MAG: C39 family peptidase [Dorea sp.]|nr:C39 family peptidase [Dorea sp.]